MTELEKSVQKPKVLFRVRIPTPHAGKPLLPAALQRIRAFFSGGGEDSNPRAVALHSISRSGKRRKPRISPHNILLSCSPESL